MNTPWWDAALLDTTHGLWTSTVVASLAVALVAVFRRPLLRVAGAGAVAQIGLLLPLMLLAACLPHTPVTYVPLPWRASAGSSPALLGLWHPHLVLPLDFEQRFDAQEQRLILAHENEHRRRWDNAWNLLSAALLVLFWFNPLAWWAQRRWRADQELACDAAVLAQNPTALPSYARAMLKSQGLIAVPALASSWLSVHPLIERTRMLQNHVFLLPRRATGQRAALALAVLCAGVAYAAQGDTPLPTPPVAGTAQRVDLQLKLSVNGNEVAAPRLISELGARTSMTYRAAPGDTDPGTWKIEVLTTQLPDGRLQLASTISSGEPLRAVGGPQVLITEPGKAFGIKVSAAAGGPALEVAGVARLLDEPKP
jgi:hypothetical protein